MKYGFYATFMPKPLYGENGSGMHVHQSLFKGGRNAFYDENDQYYLSDVAKSFIAGQLKHAREISALFAQWVNSYKRLVPGYEAPVYVAWSRRNRSALIRVPLYHPGKEQATRCEIRSPDPACNPYLCFSALLQAGLEGIEKGYELPEPMERNLYHLSPDERKKLGIEQLPETLGEAIEIAVGVRADPEDARRARVHPLHRDQAPGVGGLPHASSPPGRWRSTCRSCRARGKFGRRANDMRAWLRDHARMVVIDEMRPRDWPDASRVYAEGIATGRRRSRSARRRGASGTASTCPECRLVARRDGRVVAWAALAPGLAAPRVSRRRRGEHVRRAPRSGGVAWAARSQRRSSRRSERAGIWTLEGWIFPENEASLALCESFGCRVVGVRERLGKMGDSVARRAARGAPQPGYRASASSVAASSSLRCVMPAAAHVLLEVLDDAVPGMGSIAGRALQQPRERDLPRRGVVRRDVRERRLRRQLPPASGHQGM